MSEPRDLERSRRSPFTGAARLAGAAVVLLVQLALVFLDRPAAPRPLFGDEITYHAAAVRLLAFGAADLDPLWPPLYPYFLAPLLALGDGGLVWVRAAQLALLGLAAFLLADLGKRWTGFPEAGALAAFLLLADPQVAAFAHYLWPEVLHLALFLSAIWMLVRASSALGAPASSRQVTEGPAGMPALPAGRRALWAWATGAGLALGLALLTKSLLAPFLPLLLAPLALSGDGGRRRRGILAAGLALLVTAAVVAPAVWTQHRRGHGWVIADSSRFNLWVGLNDTSRRNLVGEIVGDEYERYRSSASTLPERNRLLAEKIRRLAEERGWPALLAAQLERQPFRLFHKDSFFTDQLPGGAIAARGFGYRHLPPPLATALRAWSYLLYGAVLALAGWGLFRVVHRSSPWWRVLLTFLAYNLAIFLVFHVKARYRVQILPVLDLYAAVAVVFWMGARGPALRERLGVAGWIGAGLVSAALLFWAFGG